MRRPSGCACCGAGPGKTDAPGSDRCGFPSAPARSSWLWSRAMRIARPRRSGTRTGGSTCSRCGSIPAIGPPGRRSWPRWVWKSSTGPAGPSTSGIRKETASAFRTSPTRRRLVDMEGLRPPHSEAPLVRRLIEQGIRDPRVLAAFGRVPRRFFVPEEAQPYAQGDHPLEIGYGQTISQPYVVAAMTEALDLRGPERVLEVGTGSGYQTAILAELLPLGSTLRTVE